MQPTTGLAPRISHAFRRGFTVTNVPPNIRVMRAIAAALLLVVAGMTAGASRPEVVSACVGRYLDFEDAIGMSDGAIYAGRITRAEIADTFWFDVTIDIDFVVRGQASTRVRRAQAGHVCDGIQVGQHGYMVLGVRDANFPGSDPEDLFFRVSRSRARAALIAAGLPDTSTSSDAETRPPPSLPWTWLAFWSATAMLAFRGLRRRDQSTSRGG